MSDNPRNPPPLKRFEPIPRDLRLGTEEIIANCSAVGRALREISTFVADFYLRIRNANLFFGALAALLEIVSLVIGTEGSLLRWVASIFSILAAIFLFASSAYFGLRGNGSPQTLTIYANYITTYRDRLTNLLQSPPSVEARHKIEIYREMAQQNLRDVEEDWPFVAHYLTAADSDKKRVLRRLLWPAAP